MARPIVEAEVFDLDINLMTRLVASQLVPIVSRGAVILRDAVRARIQLLDEGTHSAPGAYPGTPRNRPRYWQSWRASKARIYSDAVVAYAFSSAEAANGEPLAIELDRGNDRIGPRPHLDAARTDADTQIRSLVAQGERTLGA